MTIKELYEQIGGDYNEALGRLQMDKLIDRFIVKFLDDESSKKLADAWAAGDEEAAFDAAHSAKGVCSNLALTRLAAPAHAITEALRPGNESIKAATDVDALVAEFTEIYQETAEAIAAYAASK